MQTINFTDCALGLLVSHSQHYLQQHCITSEEKVGIVIDKDFYPDDVGTVICWPVVHWEGAAMPGAVHPANLVPARACVDLPPIDMIE